MYSYSWRLLGYIVGHSAFILTTVFTVYFIAADVLKAAKAKSKVKSNKKPD